MENGKDVRDAGDEKQTRHFLQSEEMAEKVADQNPPVSDCSKKGSVIW